MFILDRYLLWQFARSFVICFVSLGGLFVVIDGFGNLDSFMQYAEKQGSLAGVMAPYYGYRLLAVFDATSGVLTLVAAMFTISLFQRHNEMTALMAAGVPVGRIVRPVVWAVVAVSLAAVGVRELVIPAVRDQPGLARNAQDLLGDVARDLTPLYDQQTDILLQGKATYADTRRIHKPNFRLLRSLAKYGNQLVGEDAFYRPPQQGRPGGYLVQKVSQPAKITERPSLALADRPGRPVILTPADTPWLQKGEVFVASNVTFEQLTGGWAWRRFASVFELIGGLRNPSLEFAADVRVAIHARFVQPVLDATLLLLGLPLVVSRQQRNVFLATGLCFAVAATFMVVVIVCQEMGRQSLVNPALAAWLPLFVFVPAAAVVAEPLVTGGLFSRGPTAKPAPATPP
jgi:lipopolysaccharide export system permease protein